MFIKSQLRGCVACSNVVSTLETLAAFVLHITQAGPGGEMLQILAASAPLRGQL